jgi:hypothetical protein
MVDRVNVDLAGRGWILVDIDTMRDEWTFQIDI